MPNDAPIVAEIKDIIYNSVNYLLVALAVGWVLKRALGWLAQRMSQSPVAQAMVAAMGKSSQILIPAYTLSNAINSNIKYFPEGKQAIVATGCTFLLSVAHTATAFQLISIPIAWAQKLADETENKLDDVLVPMVGTVAKVTVVLVGAVKAVSIIDPEIAKSVLALLATGAVAVGFAAQDTIKNIFGAVMLIIDQPFTLGDVVNIGSHEGKIEALGLRSTTIVLLDGQRVAIPNGDLAGRAITNVTRREFIRAQDLVHLEMNTPAEKIEEALKIIRELVTNHEGHDHRHPPAVHVLEFGEWAVNIRFMYWYRPANSSKQLEFNQKLMLQIMDRLQKANIRLASQGTPQNR